MLPAATLAPAGDGLGPWQEAGLGRETPLDARGTEVEVPTLGLSRWAVPRHPPPRQVLSGCPLAACPARCGAPSMLDWEATWFDVQ